MWPVSGWAEGLAGVRVPHPHRLVAAGGNDPVAVGLNATPVTLLVWPVSGAPRGWPFRVPQPHRVVPAGGGDPVPVGAERHTGHIAGVAGQRRAEGLAGVGVPHPHRLVALAEAIRCPSGLNATPYTGPVWPVSGGAEGLAGGGVPHPHRAVAAGGGDPMPVGAERHTEHIARCGRSAARRGVGRCRRSTPAPSRRCWRRRSGGRRG